MSNWCIGWIVGCIDENYVNVIFSVYSIYVKVKVVVKWYFFNVYIIGFSIDCIYIVGRWVY